jgi:uncharacterized membrane protein
MAHAENTITIDRPIKKVFEFVLDGMNAPLWRPSVADVKLLPGKPLGVGAVYKQGLKGPTGRIDGDYELVEVKPEEWIRFQVIAGPARPSGTYKFEAVGSGTKVTFILDFQPKGLAKLMDGMINSTMKEEVGTLSNLKSYLEAQH